MMTSTRRTRKQQQQQQIKKPNRQLTEDSSDQDSSDVGSVTRCICGESHNLGLMVQCDQCEVWQHCECIGLLQDKLPDHYYCDQCQPENHQVVKTSNGKSKRLYHAALPDSSPSVSNSDSKSIKKRKKTPSPQPTEEQLRQEDIKRRTKTEPAKSPVIKLDEPYWDYTDGRPARESSPPARVKYPHTKMSFSDMNKRAKQIMECITKLRSEEECLSKRHTEEYFTRPRSLSTCSSLSSASTVPLLDDFVTTEDSSSSSNSSSPITPIPFIASTQATKQREETCLDILERVDRELVKFQRKFGVLYQ
ncbi:uncharacterized protein B0P05DRAFT_536701 [Gilbertella persicaria]|uniref:uncharacterized protein n=1 Tax=Gilbertella persicaria TaxID=101096 RepID=UPI0022202CBE|nr:uncharacterized protein B0P05DRAFT_536701 [Gilbertella persicaria]KAI8083252.1 hypothetical protein B0P05DRAFT_536701 [Gilbertella persicaria]